MNIDKFKELLSVPTKTYEETKMVEYIMSSISDMDGVTLTCDEHNNIYATKGTLDEGEFYPMFISHTDTVHELVDEIIVKEEMLSRPNTFGKTFDKEPVPCLKAYNEKGNPTGIGGDDKCGIFICLELLKQLDKVKVAFFVSEETGCHGSRNCNVDFLKDVGYCAQYDAPGDHLISLSCSGTQLFDVDGEFFKLALPSVIKSFKNEMMVQSHPYTDIMQIKQKSDFSCINISCGYYNMHTSNEFVCVDDVVRAIEAGKNLVKDLGLKKYGFEYKPFVYPTYDKFEDDDIVESEIDKIHSLVSVDVFEEECGIMISDVYDGTGLFIDNDDCFKLYEILQERIYGSN